MSGIPEDEAFSVNRLSTTHRRFHNITLVVWFLPGAEPVPLCIEVPGDRSLGLAAMQNASFRFA